MDKSELIDSLQRSRDQLEAELEGLDPADFDVAGVMDDWTLKDVIAHLNRWEGECITMLFDLSRGKQPARFEINSMDTVDAMNARWHEEDLERPLDLVLSDFRGLRKQTLRRVDEMAQADLTDPQLHDFLRGEPLWHWIAEDTFQHEQEHLPFIQAWRNERRTD